MSKTLKMTKKKCVYFSVINLFHNQLETLHRRFNGTKKISFQLNATVRKKSDVDENKSKCL